MAARAHPLPSARDRVGQGRPASKPTVSGDDIAEAKAWAARRSKNAPEPTALHFDFIRASEEEAEARSSAQREQLEAMAAAQAERETALHEAEEAQRKRATMARIRNIALVAVSMLALLGGWLYWSVEQQRAIANRVLTGATNIIVEVQSEMNDDTKKEVFHVVSDGRQPRRCDFDGPSRPDLLLRFGRGAGLRQGARVVGEGADKGDTSYIRSNSESHSTDRCTPRSRAAPP